MPPQFGGRTRIYWHLHPPLLRAMGLKRKLRLGGWARPVFALLRALRRAAGHAARSLRLRAKLRQVERALIGEYRALVLRALDVLSPVNHEIAVQIAALPDLVRGYEAIKLRNVTQFRERAAALEAEARRGARKLPLSAGGAQA